MLLLYPWLWWCLEGMSSPRRFSKTSLNVRRYVWRSSTEKVGSSTFYSSWFGDFDAWATERSSDVRYYIFWGIVYLSQKYWHFHWVKLSPVGQKWRWQLDLFWVSMLQTYGNPSFKVGFFNFLLAPRKFMNFTSPEWFDGCLVDEISCGHFRSEGFQCENTPWNKQFVPELNRQAIFQPSIFRCKLAVSFREGFLPPL